MMSTAIYERIRNNPKFDELVAKRSRFAWTLTAIVLGIYFIFIMIVAFNPKLLATPIWAGGCLLYTSPFLLQPAGQIAQRLDHRVTVDFDPDRLVDIR